MENLIATVVFVLPGFMLYFWIQMLGINPVVKHSTIEFGALSALAWFPVIIMTFQIMKLFDYEINTLDEVKTFSNDIIFLTTFSIISILMSFIISLIYVFLLHRVMMLIVNYFRVKNNKLKLSKSPSVWEEMFFEQKQMIIGIAKYGSQKPDIIGNVAKVSRPFEAKRGFKLIYVDYVTSIVEKYEVPIIEVFSDIDSGVNVYVYDIKSYLEADLKERKSSEYTQTPSRSSTF